MEQNEPEPGREFVERAAIRTSGCSFSTRLFGSPSNLPQVSHFASSQQVEQQSWYSTRRFTSVPGVCKAGSFGNRRHWLLDFVTRHYTMVMASTVVKRIPLIRFPARMKRPATPPAASAGPASGSSSSALGAEPKSTPPIAGVDAAGSSGRGVLSQKP